MYQLVENQMNQSGPGLQGNNVNTCNFFLAIAGCWAYIVGQDPSDSKSSRLHVDIIFRCCFIHLRYIPYVDSSKMIGNCRKVSNFNRLFLKLHRCICN